MASSDPMRLAQDDRAELADFLELDHEQWRAAAQLSKDAPSRS